MGLLSKIAKIINRSMDNTAERILDELREACPKKTGATAASFRIMDSNSSYIAGVNVTDRIVVASDELTAYWADHGNYDSGWIIQAKHPTTRSRSGVPMLGKYPDGIPGYGWRASVQAYEGTHFVRKVANRHR